MPWNERLREPITLTDGRRIAALADVHELVLDLPSDRAAAPQWRLVLTLLENTEKHPTRETLRSLQEQLRSALAREGML